MSEERHHHGEHTKLMQVLAQLKPPRLSPQAYPWEIEAVREHLLALTNAVDDYIEATGAELNRHILTPLDVTCFKDVLADALHDQGALAEIALAASSAEEVA